MAPNQDGGTGEDQAPTPARTLLADPRLFSILLLSGVGVFGSQIVPPALPAIQSGLGVSDARIGLVLTALYGPSMVLLPVVGAISDVFGRRLISLASLAVFGIAGVAIYFAPTFEVLLALRLVQGVCFSALTPLTVAYIGDFFQGQDGTTAQGLRSSTIGLVIVVVPAVAGVLADLAWNLPFLLYAVAFPALLVVHRHFPEPEAFEREVDRSLAREFREWFDTVTDALDDRQVILLLVGGFALFVVRNVIMTIAPLLATRAIDLTPSVVGVSLSTIGVVRIVLSPQAGRFAARLSRKVAFLVTLALVGVSMVVFAGAESLAGFVGAILTFAVGISLFNPTLNDAITASASAGNRAGVVSAFQSAKNVGNTFSPAVAGALLALTGFRTVFLASGGVIVVYLAAFLAYYRR